MYFYGSYRKINTGFSLFWTTLYKYVSELKHCFALQEDTDNINQWADDLKLKLNVSKCDNVVLSCLKFKKDD